MKDAIFDLAAAVGILPVYTDQTRRDRETTPETARALLAAMGMPAETRTDTAARLAALKAAAARRVLPEWCVLTAATAPALGLPTACTWELTLEDGTCVEGRGDALPVLPMGRHALRIGDDVTWLLAAPPALPLPRPGWGITVPLYGLRPPERGGIGDFKDLQNAVAGLGRAGAGFVGINPIHAGFPAAPDAFSPYAPSHRRRLNVMHLACPVDTAGRGSPLIDYPASMAIRADQEAKAYAETSNDPTFDAFLTGGGVELRRFALHQALSERYGAFWDRWPTALRNPDTDETRAFAEAHPEELRYHAWLQWRADEALRRVAGAADDTGMRHGLYLDLAVGTHPYGAETWAEPDQFAQGTSLGAPPDAFAADGQVWGLAPFNAVALADTGFAALADTLRCQFRYARLLRIDHILGFERAFWVPSEGGLPGAYVSMPREAMLAVTRIEAARAGATVVGEDLGNIPDGLQEAMTRSGLLGCRLVQFEHDAVGAFRTPTGYDPATLAAFGTHDLPSFRGWRAGRDITVRANLGMIDAETSTKARADRAREVSAFDDTADGPPGDTDTLNAFLGSTGSRLVALQIEDLLDIEDQPNLPGTVHDYPNWRRRLPIGPDALRDHPSIAAAARAMALSGRGDL